MQAGHGSLQRAQLLWVVFMCALLMAAPSLVARVMLPLRALSWVPLQDALLAFPPAIYGIMSFQVWLETTEPADIICHVML